MRSKATLFVIFFVTNIDGGQLRELDGTTDTSIVHSEIDNYFNDCRYLDVLCEKFVEEFDVNVCEMEGGKRRDNRNGFFFENEIHNISFHEDHGSLWDEWADTNEHSMSKSEDNQSENDVRRLSGFQSLSKSPLTPYVNSAQAKLDFTASVYGKDGAVSGMSSTFVENAKDRMYKFISSAPKGGVTKSQSTLLPRTARDRYFAARCPSNMFLTSITSQFYNYYNDRYFDFGCSSFEGVAQRNCVWSPWINTWKEDFTFECAAGKAIAGIASYHYNYHQDRRFAFFCCSMEKTRGMCRSHGYSTPFTGALFKKEVRLLVADPNFNSNDFRHAREALQNFNYCTEDLINFQFDTHIIKTDVSGKSWMQAAYEIMKKAEEDGIEINKKGKTQNKNNFVTYFNMDQYMTMIIVPDDVDFEGAFGFAILHNGLSIIKASEAKNSKSIIHEIGHNMGMRHSSHDGDEYGDDRCIMGEAKDHRVCFNGAKNFFLGLYLDVTRRVYLNEHTCNLVWIVADLYEHLYQRRTIREEYGEYSVVIQVTTANNFGKDLFLMYYVDGDIVVGTEGRWGEIVDKAGKKLTFADSSERVFDLNAGESIVYKGNLYKRCPSSGTAATRVLMSNDPNGVNEC